MGMLDIYRCPNTECWWNEVTGKKGDICPECGTPLEKFGFRDGSKLSAEKSKLAQDPELRQKVEERKKEIKAAKMEAEVRVKEEKRVNNLLFHSSRDDEDLIKSIESDMSNLAMHEAGTKWMRAGTLLSFDATQQMIGAGFKAIIDQNKILIKQNELLYRQNKLLNENLKKLNK
ncbi:MAG: hypothetical protein LLF83_05820 [Methanobacterium sp.]|nr:hypothetical protein [Methanobacterium sp.]